MKTLRTFLMGLLFVGLSGLSMPSFADDTEIYFQAVPRTDSSVRPNLLFIMDNSGSMNDSMPWTDVDPNSACLNSTDKTKIANKSLTRMIVLKDALCKVLDDAQNLNIGLERFTFDTALGGNNPILYPIDNISTPFASATDSVSYDIPVQASEDDAEEGATNKPVILDEKILELANILGEDILSLPTTKLLEIPVTDDAREQLGDKVTAGTVYTTDGSNKDLELGSNKNDGEQIVGLRFADSAIPNGATILAAWIEFTANTSDCNCWKSMSVKVNGFDGANTPAFAASSKNISNRALTTAGVNWNNIESWSNGKTYTSPDLSDIIDSLVKRTDWVSGNALGLSFIRNPAYSADTPDNASTANRRFYSVDEATSAYKAPVLKLFYTTETGYSAGAAAVAARTFVPKPGTVSATITQQIADNDNDAYEFLTSGNRSCKVGGVVKNDSSGNYTMMALGEGRPSSSSNYGSELLGFRFPDLSIPKNATITNAKLTFNFWRNSGDVNQSASSAPLNMNIFVEDHVNPDNFSIGNRFNTSCSSIGGDFNLSKRSKTASVTWADVASWTSDGKVTTPDLKTAVQPVIDNANWDSANNALVFLLEPTLTNSSRRIYDCADANSNCSYANNPTTTRPVRTAQLDISYDPPSAGSDSGTTGQATIPQTIGLRFQNVKIPSGASVKSAYISFTSGPKSTTAANLTIKALKSTDVQPFQAQPLNISSRATTAASVTWNASSAGNPMTAWETDTVYRTPELKTLVQEVVGQGGWCGGNNLGFVISSSDLTSLRNAQSYDNDPDAAPSLHIEFLTASVPPGACMQQTFTSSITDANDDGVQTTTRDDDAGDNTVFLTGSIDDSTLNIASTKKAGTNTLTKRLVGVRFQNIPIAPNTPIKGAKLVFTGTDGTSADENLDVTNAALAASASLTIQGEAGLAAPFSTNTNNFGSRPKTSTVNWSIPDTQQWTNNTTYSSPDLTAMVQSIVNSGSWAANGSMAFFITSNDSSSLRKAASFEKSPTLNTRLEIRTDATLSTTGYSRSLRDILKDEVRLMSPLGWTPTSDAMYEAALYYRGGQVSGGATARRGYKMYRISHPLSHTNPLGYFQKSAIPTSSSTIGTYYNITSTPYAPKCSTSNVGYPLSTECQLEFIFQPNTPSMDFSTSLGFSLPSAKATYRSPMTDSLCQTNHIVLLSDGEPTKNNVAGIVVANGGSKPAKSYAACGSTPTVTCKAYIDEMYDTDGAGMSDITCSAVSPSSTMGKCGPEIAGFLANNDNKTGIPGSIIKTHTIGMNLGGSTSKGEAYLKAIAAAGKGNYYRADTSADLLLAFRTIIATAMTDASSFASPAVSVNVFNRLYHNNEIYFTFFKPDNKVSWAGNVKRYNLCTAATGCASSIVGKNGTAAVGSDGSILSSSQDVWNTTTESDGAKVTSAGAGGVLPAPDSRNIYSNVVGDVAIALTDAVNAVKTTNTSLTDVMLNVSTDANPATARSDIINWIRGYEDAAAGVLRDWRFGDPLHSTPGVFTYGKETDGTPKTKVIVNTNEGAIRMLDGKTGVEDWMFVPREMLAIQKNLRTADVAFQRIYGIDGKPVVWVRDNNYNGTIESASNDSVWVFTGMRRGGRSIYALDVTPDTVNPPAHKPRLVWTISNTTSGFSNLGQTWSTPIVTKVLYNGAAKTVLLFGGGYDPSTQDTSATYQTPTTTGNAIYMVDPLDGGKLLWWASSNTSSASLKLTGMNYSIPSDLTVIDGDGDGFTDRIYVGDTGGQLWRVDIRDVGAGYAVGGRLAVIGDGTASDAGKRRFFYPPDVARLTDVKYSPYAPDFDLVLIGSGHRPNPLNKTIQDRLYAFRDRQTGWLIGDANAGKSGNAAQDTPATLDQTVAGGSAPANTKFFTINENKLYDATAEVLNSTTATQATLDGAKAAIQKSLGWKVDLVSGIASNGDKTFIGEKALAKPLVLKGVAYYTTFVPPQPSTETVQTDVCSASFDQGKAKAYAINILTGEGGLPNEPRSKDIGGGIPAEPIAVFTESGISVYASVGSSDPSNSTSTPGIKNIGPGSTLPRETVYWIEE